MVGHTMVLITMKNEENKEVRKKERNGVDSNVPIRSARALRNCREESHLSFKKTAYRALQVTNGRELKRGNKILEYDVKMT